jgi:hypothetical protein
MVCESHKILTSFKAFTLCETRLLAAGHSEEQVPNEHECCAQNVGDGLEENANSSSNNIRPDFHNHHHRRWYWW